MTRYARVQRAVEGQPCLLRTIHGSRLYGLSHADSDFDWYFVYDTDLRRGNQSVHGDYDETIVPKQVFMEQIANGHPKALEALFSPSAERSPVFEELARTFRVGPGPAVRGTRSLLRSFALNDTFKNRRHILRLAFQLRDTMEYGRFNPVLTPERIVSISHEAAVERDDFEETMERWFSWAVSGVDYRGLTTL